MAPVIPIGGISAVFRPIFVAGASVALLFLLIVSFLLTWKNASDSGSDISLEVSVNGLGTRTFFIAGDEMRMDYSVINFTTLISAALIFLLVGAGALLVALTGHRRIGATILTASAVLGLLYAFIGMVTDFGIFNKLMGNSMDEGAPDAKSGIGVFLALFFSLLLLVVAVFYLFKEFGVVGGSRPTSVADSGSPAGYGASAGPWGVSQESPSSSSASQQAGTNGQQAVHLDPQIPPSPGRWS